MSLTSGRNTHDGERLRWRARAVALLLIAGCAAVGAAQERKPVNRMCPVMTEEEVDPTIVVEYGGRVIGLCCEKCLAKFEANPEKYAARVVADADDVAADPADTQPPEPTRTVAGGRTVPARGGVQPTSGLQTLDAPGGAAPRTGAARVIEWVGRFHPASVHLPIGLMFGAIVAESLRILTRREFFLPARQFCLWLGCAAAALSAALGWCFAGAAWSDPRPLLTWHRWLGTATAGAIIAATWLARRADRVEPPRGALALFRAALLVATVMAGSAGFLGGALVWGLNHYAW